MRIEKRQSETDEGQTIVGHAAVFNVTDGPVWFRERIEPGAFADTIKSDDIRALFNHDSNLVLGRNTAGTLNLREDEEGLFMEIQLPDTTAARDLTVSMERGDVSQASFAFRTIDDEWRTEDGNEVRILKRVQLYDVSPVTFPFYENTDVSLRAFEKHLEALDEKRRGAITQAMNLRKKRLELLRV
jgi:HK97 family phage prohead protease